jgi:hypothetical protein
MCPKGVDPFQAFTELRVINITTSSNGDPLSGFFEFTMGWERFKFSANATKVRP